MRRTARLSATLAGVMVMRVMAGEEGKRPACDESGPQTLYFAVMASKNPVTEGAKYKALSNYVAARTPQMVSGSAPRTRATNADNDSGSGSEQMRPIPTSAGSGASARTSNAGSS